jgi:hypothetical protein
MWKITKRRVERGSAGFTGETRPAWGHPARHEDGWPAQRNRELVQLLAVTANR